MEQTFRANDTVLLIGIVRTAAVLVLGGELLNVYVLEAIINDSKGRQLN